MSARFVGAEAVHLGEQLVQSVLPLVVGREADILAPRAPDGVDFIYEHYAGGLLLRLGEEVAHTARSHAYEHFDEIGAADAEERHIGLSGHGLGQQGLSGSRRAHEQSALGNLSAQCCVLSGILEEIHDLHDLLLGAVHSGHILEGHVDLVLVGELACGLADIEGVHASAAAPAASAAHLARHAAEQPGVHQQEKQEGKHPFKDAAPHPRLVVDVYPDLGVGRKLGVHLGELLLGIELRGGEEIELRRLGRHLAADEEIGIFGHALGLYRYVALVVVADEMYLLDIAVAHHLLHLGPLHLLWRDAAVAEQHPAYGAQQQYV